MKSVSALTFFTTALVAVRTATATPINSESMGWNMTTPSNGTVSSNPADASSSTGNYTVTIGYNLTNGFPPVGGFNAIDGVRYEVDFGWKATELEIITLRRPPSPKRD
jgi:hypothetical protein